MEFKLLRGPGETLRRKVNRIDEDSLQSVAGWVGGTLLISGSAAAIAIHFKQTGLGLILGFGVYLIGLVGYGWWFYRQMKERRNCLLGYLGERAVAEELQKLEAEGFQIFHDVPFGDKKKSFNIDHVVVGSTGIFAIETKTRRKGKAREGFKDYEVHFNGQKLVWPWGEDTWGLEQASRQADSLKQWLLQMTGLPLVIQPVLALPGWFVEERNKLGPVRVLSHKNVAKMIRSSRLGPLTPEQVDLISRQLDSRCRDVED